VQTQEILAYSVLGILICNILVLVILGVIAWVVVKKIGELSKSVESVLHKADGIMQTAQAVAANAENATRHISGSAASAHQIVGSVEQAITPTLSLFAATRTTARTPDLKMKLLGAGLGLAVRYFLQRRNGVRHA
jgi:predicted PurR-regulated permease PerM